MIFHKHRNPFLIKEGVFVIRPEGKIQDGCPFQEEGFIHRYLCSDEISQLEQSFSNNGKKNRFCWVDCQVITCPFQARARRVVEKTALHETSNRAIGAEE